MPERKILDFKPAPRPEQVGDQRPKQLDDRKHRTAHALILPIARIVGWNFRERQLTTLPRIQIWPIVSKAM